MRRARWGEIAEGEEGGDVRETWKNNWYDKRIGDAMIGISEAQMKLFVR